MQIRIIGERILREKSQKVTRFDPKLEKLGKEMIDLMHSADGIGLAAPQVGISQRFLVTDVSSLDKNYGPMIFVNPEIIESGGQTTIEEGCLSIPGVKEEVTRPEYILLTYHTVNGEQKKERFDGWMARVLQHEIDHLEGILFVDYLSPVKQKLALRNLQYEKAGM